MLLLFADIIGNVESDEEDGLIVVDCWCCFLVLVTIERAVFVVFCCCRTLQFVVVDAGVVIVVGRSKTGRRRRCEADNTNSGSTLGISRVKREAVVCVGIAAAAVIAALFSGSTAVVRGGGGGGGGGGDTDLVGDFFSFVHSSLCPATSIMMMILYELPILCLLSSY